MSKIGGGLTQFFRGWKAFDYIFCTAAIILPIVSAVIFNSSIWQCLSTVITLLFCLFSAKGVSFANFLGLAALFVYAYVAFVAHLYGEVIIQVCIVLPITIVTIVTWYRNKQKDEHDNNKVTVAKVSLKELVIVMFSQIIMGVGYYFLLGAFNTENLIISVVAMETEIVGFYLLMRRCPYAFWAFLVHSIVLIVLWGVKSLGDYTYIAVLLMPVFNAISNTYGIISWAKLQKSQAQSQ